MNGEEEGSYRLLWVSHDHWRDDFKFPDFSLSEFADPAHGWMLRQGNYRAAAVVVIRALLNPGRQMTLLPHESVAAVTDQVKDGNQVKCVETSMGAVGRILCFDATSGWLRTLKAGGAAQGFERQYGDYRPLGQLQFPRRIEGGWLESVKLNVTSLDTSSQLAPDLSEHPGGAEPWLTCDEATAAQKAFGQEFINESTRAFGKIPLGVRFDAVVDAHGRIQDLFGAVPGAGTGLSPQETEAVKKWRFDPAKCGGVATPFESLVGFGS